MRIDFITIFPRMFDPLLAEGVIARGVKGGQLDIRVHDLRDYTTDRHRSTDDEAYGGGPGMVMLGEPVFRAVEAIDGGYLVMTSPQGRRFDQSVANELARKEHVVFLCGRYEGFDHRVHESLQPDEISIGDFVVSGGELPAMVMADAIGRLIRGRRQQRLRRGGLILPRPARLSALHAPRGTARNARAGHSSLRSSRKIRKWRKELALRATLEKRPDLLETAELDDEAREILRKLGKF